MTLKEALFASNKGKDEEEQKKSTSSSSSDDDESSTDNGSSSQLTAYMDNIVKNKNWKQFVLDIKKPSNTGGKASEGFYIKDIYIPFRNINNGKPSEAFILVANKLKNGCTNIQKTLSQYSSKNTKYQSFIDTNLLPALENPQSIAKDVSKGTNGSKDVVSTEYYRRIGEALVYRSSEFISKLADSKTKVDSHIFNQLMVDAFNGKDSSGENENFLMQFTDIDQKMRVDAAKQVVYQVEHNGDQKSDGEQKFGSSAEDESYYTDLQQIINNGGLTFLNESVNVPRKMSDFSQNIKELMEQVKAVEQTWPRQFKSWFDKYQSSFEEGVKEGQDAIRDTKNKEVKDPLTGKKLSGRKAWGTGGPNAFIRDHEYIDKLCQGIKGQKTTIFNLGPKMILGIFDMLEHGGKILQGIKDEFGEAFKDIKKLLRSGSSKEFNDQIDQLIKDGEFGAAEATAEACAVVQFTQLLNLLQNGPIGTVDLTNKTFTTAMSNDQTSIEVAVQNLLASLDKYTETEKRFEENKDVKINDAQTDSVIGGKSGKKEKPKQDSDNNDKEEDEEIDDSYKPTLKNFILHENDGSSDDESHGESAGGDDADDESQTGITHSEQANQTLNDYELVKKNFDDTVDKKRLKEVMEALQKFKGEEGDVVRNKEGEKSDFTDLDKIINLYKLLSEDDLKFNMDAASLKDFLDGIKKYIEDFKEIPAIENLAVKISENDTKWPAMETTGKLEKKTSSGQRATQLASKIESQQNTLMDSHIKDLVHFAKTAKNDTWLKEYEARIKSLDGAVKALTKELESVYGTGKLPKWYYSYFQMFQSKHYLLKLYMLMSCMAVMRNQLKKYADEEPKGPDEEGDEGGSSDSETVANPEQSNVKGDSYKPKTLVRSLYLNETEEQQANQSANGNTPKTETPNGEVNRGDVPTKDTHGQADWKVDPTKLEPIKHSINQLGKSIESVNFNTDMLPTDINAEYYNAKNPQEMNSNIQSFAGRAPSGLSIDKGDNGNGIVSITRNLLQIKFSTNGAKNYDICKKFNGTEMANKFTTSDDKNRDNSDLYLYFAAAHCVWFILNGNVDKVFKDADTKLRKGKREADEIAKNGQTEGGETAEPAGGNNGNGKGVEDSVIYPDVSPDSFLNEIYKYIRG